MATRYFQFELTGRTPLLMHADDLAKNSELDAWRNASENKNIKVNGDDRSPAWTWQTYLYDDGERVAMPSDNLMTCLRQAGSKVTLHKQTSCKMLSQSAIFIPHEYLEFTVNGKQISVRDIVKIKNLPFADQCKACESLGFRLFAKRATIGKAKHVRVRPRFDSWTVVGSLEVLDEKLTDAMMAEIFSHAESIGLGDWRPGGKTPGSFGMFSASLQSINPGKSKR